MKAISSTAVALLIVVSAFAQKANLTLNLENGKTYNQVTKSNIVINQNYGGQEIKITMIVSGAMAYLVKSVSPTEYELEVKYDNITMEMTAPNGTMSFNSDKKDPNDVMSLMMAEMVNKPFTVIMLKDGKIKSIANSENLYSTIFDGFPDLSPQQREQIKEQLAQSFGEKTFRGNIEMTTAFLPNKAVAKGEKWTVDSSIESTMKLAVNSTYEYIEKGAGYHKIHGDSKLETATGSDFVESNGIPMKFSLNGTMTSDIKIDDKSGWVIEATLKQELKGHTEIKGNEQMPDGMIVPMTMISETKVAQ